jgi:hypothetical protein
MRKAKAGKTKMPGRRDRPETVKFTIAAMEIAKLELQPNDIVVLRTDFMLTKDQCFELRARAQEQFPAGTHIVILTSGLNLMVLRDERAKAA